MSAWTIALLVLGYIAIGAQFAVSLLRIVDPQRKLDYDDCGYVAAIAFVWPVVLVCMMFSLFGRLLIRIATKGGKA